MLVSKYEYSWIFISKLKKTIVGLPVIGQLGPRVFGVFWLEQWQRKESMTLFLEWQPEEREFAPSSYYYYCAYNKPLREFYFSLTRGHRPSFFVPCNARCTILWLEWTKTVTHYTFLGTDSFSFYYIALGEKQERELGLLLF